MATSTVKPVNMMWGVLGGCAAFTNPPLVLLSNLAFLAALSGSSRCCRGDRGWPKQRHYGPLHRAEQALRIVQWDKLGCLWVCY